MSNVTIFPFPMRKNNKSCFLLSRRFFQVNIFVQMQVDKYLYNISENEIVYSSGYATILRYRLRQTGQEILYYSG